MRIAAARARASIRSGRRSCGTWASRRTTACRRFWRCSRVREAARAPLFFVTDPRLGAGRNNRVPAGFRDSFQTRALAGASTHGLPDGETTAEHLHAAKARLESFDLVMTVESLDDDVAVLAAAAGWAPPNMTAGRRGSMSNSAAQLAALDSTTRAALEAKVAYDDELYKHAQALSARAREKLAAGEPVVSAARPYVPKCSQLQSDATALSKVAHTPGGPYGNWSYGCRHGACFSACGKPVNAQLTLLCRRCRANHRGVCRGAQWRSRFALLAAGFACCGRQARVPARRRLLRRHAAGSCASARRC